MVRACRSGAVDSLRVGFRSGIAAACAALALMAPCADVATVAARAEVVSAACGVTATIHDADEIAARWLFHDDGRLWFRHPLAGQVELLSGPDDPRLPRQGVEAFVPLAVAPVARAIEAVAGIRPALTVEVFLLPSTPVETLGSIARRDCILLAPGMGPVAEEAVHPLVVHELGHVLEWAYLDCRPERWEAFLELRQLDATDNGATASHADRAREILAEDIRVLFGGEIARAGGSLENASLPSPDAVAGLRDLLAAWLSGPAAAPAVATARAFPSPASGPVRLEWAPDVDSAAAMTGATEGAADAVLEIYDVRGRRVRRITGLTRANGRLLAGWDGRDGAGRPVPAGPYAFLIRAGRGSARGSLVMVR